MVALSPLSSAAMLAARATEDAGDTSKAGDTSSAKATAAPRDVARALCATWIQAAVEKAAQPQPTRRRQTPPPPAVPPPPPPAWSASMQLASRISAHTGTPGPRPVPAFPIGSDVEYYSDTHKRWITTRVLGYTSSGYELGCKPRASATKVRLAAPDPNRASGPVRDNVVLPSKIGRAVRVLAAQCRAQTEAAQKREPPKCEPPKLTTSAAPILREEAAAGSLEQLFAPAALDQRAVAPSPAKNQAQAMHPFFPATRA